VGCRFSDTLQIDATGPMTIDLSQLNFQQVIGAAPALAELSKTSMPTPPASPAT
jgi:hypothetical protein